MSKITKKQAKEVLQHREDLLNEFIAKSKELEKENSINKLVDVALNKLNDHIIKNR